MLLDSMKYRWRMERGWQAIFVSFRVEFICESIEDLVESEILWQVEQLMRKKILIYILEFTVKNDREMKL